MESNKEAPNWELKYDPNDEEGVQVREKSWECQTMAGQISHGELLSEINGTPG